jgi:hypothetical protein
MKIHRFGGGFFLAIAEGCASTIAALATPFDSTCP